MKKKTSNLLILAAVCFFSVWCKSQVWAHHDGGTADEQTALKKLQIEVPAHPINAQNFKGILANGQPTELKEYQNKLVFLNFWATWCVPCLKELPDMEKLHQELSKEGFVILAVGMGESQEKIQKFIQTHKFTFPIIADPEMEISQSYSVQNIPVTYLIDQKGGIFGRTIGPRAWAAAGYIDFFRHKLKAGVP